MRIMTIYAVEYKCTKNEIIVITTIIVTLTVSKNKPKSTLYKSNKIQLYNFSETTA